MKVSTKKYINNQNRWTRRYFRAELKGMRRAVDKVESSYVQDKAQANEWRGALKDQQTKNVTKSELAAWILFIITLAGLVISYIK